MILIMILLTLCGVWLYLDTTLELDEIDGD
jgi:hypothetical protein